MAPNGLGLMELLGTLGISGLHHPQLEETVQLHLRVELLALIATWKDFTFVNYLQNLHLLQHHQVVGVNITYLPTTNTDFVNWTNPENVSIPT